MNYSRRYANRVPKSTSLRLEALESRELLDACGIADLVPPPIDYAESPFLEDVAPVDLSTAEILESNAATTWVVSSTSDDVSVQGTLRHAIANADDGDTITFDASLQNATITLGGTQLEITKSITIDASNLWNDATQTPGITIDGNQQSRVFYAEDVDVAFVGLTIANGYADDYNDGWASGGGVCVWSGNAAFTNCAVVGNVSFGEGGGVYANGDVTFVNCVVSDNSACVDEDGDGDGGGGVAVYGNASFENCAISGNEAVEGAGGGAYVYGFASFTSCEISDNYSAWGGGGADISGDSAFFYCVVSGNTSDYGAGGVSIEGAYLDYEGDDSYVSGHGYFDNSAVVGNYGDEVGGLSISGYIETLDCTIGGNSSEGDVGGVHFMRSWDDEMQPTSSIGHIINTIIAGNSGDDVCVTWSDYWGDQTIESLVYGYNSLSSFTDWAVHDEENFDNYVYNPNLPLFADAANGDYTLAVGSQAIDKGLDDYASGEFDLAGAPRIVGAAVDIGAYEFQGETPSQGEAPSAPQNVAITDYYASERAPKLTWRAATSEYGVDGYKIYLVEGATATVIATVSANTRAYSQIAEVVDLQDNSAYVFGVAAYNAYGESEIATVTLDTLVPPSGELVVETSDYDYENGEITLFWNAVDYADGYRVEVLSGADTWTTVCTTVSVGLTLTGLTDFADYSYRVVAFNAAGDGTSGEVAFSTSAPPDAPAEVDAHFNRVSKTATIAWSLCSGASGYNVYVQTESGDAWQKIAETSPFTTEYIATDLSYFSTYAFGVSAFNDLGESEKTTATIYTVVVPDAPTGLVVVDAENYDGDGTATLAWESVEGAESYAISYKLGDAVVSVGSTTETSYEISGLENYQEYVFAVVAVNSEGASEEATVAFSAMIPPSAEFVVEAGAYDYENNAVALVWDAVDYADGYRVDLRSSGGEWTTVGTTTATEFALTDLEDFAVYDCRVVAYNAKGNGSTAIGTFFTLAPPEAPTNLAVELGRDAATITWSAVDYAESYVVEQNVDGAWTVVSSDSIEPVFVFDAIEPSASYSFRVAAVDAAGASEWTEIAFDTPSILGALVVTSASDSATDPGSLRYALSVAKDGDTIVFDSSLKGSTITLGGKQLDIAKSITIDASDVWDEDAQTPGVTIDGAAKSRVFNVSGGEFALIGLRIANGKASGFGGGVYVTTKAAGGTFENCFITDNVATTKGAGVYLEKSATFTNCVVSGNTATSDGGGVYLTGKGVVGTFDSCVIMGNASKTNGGGVVLYNGAVGDFVFSALNGNTANARGGGAYIYGSGSAGTFTNTSIFGNSARNNGGGVDIYSRGSGTFEDCLITENSATASTGRGGGVSVAGSGSVGTFTNCAIGGNSAGGYGGGADINSSGSGTFANCLIAENSVTASTGRGGGVSVAGNGTFTNCTISMNSTLGASGHGGGVSVSSGAANFYNSLVVLNRSDDVYKSGGKVNAYNTTSTFASWTAAENVFAYDPELPLFVDAENGDYQLALYSQALNIGDNEYVATELDLAGEPRVVADVVDLGAFEFQPRTTLDAPTITSTSSTASSITVEWSEVEGAIGYRITCGEYAQDVDAETLTHTVTGLEAGSTYEVQVRALGDGASFLDSPETQTTVKTTSIVQLARPALTATATTAATISVEWGAIPNASSYTLSYAVKASSPVYTEIELPADATSYTISGLNALTNYYVKIRANGDGAEYKNSAQSPTQTAKTTALVQLARPALTATATTAATISVEWAAIPNASSYTLSYAVKATSPVYTEIELPADATSRTISGLNPLTNYYVKIRANGDGAEYKNSAQSPTQTAKTTALVQLARPALTATATTAATISVEWEAIPNASSYTLSYAVKATSPVYTEVPIDANATSYKVTGLDASTNYYVKIKAVGDGVYYKDSAQSPTITAKTAAPVPVQLTRPALTATATTASTISVEWAAIPNASAYTLSYAVKATSPIYTEVQIDASATSFTITGLNASTNYYVKIKALGDGVYYKDSAQSPTVTAKTLADASNALLVADYAVALNPTEDDYAFDATLAELADEAFEELFEEAFDEFEIEFV